MSTLTDIARIETMNTKDNATRAMSNTRTPSLRAFVRRRRKQLGLSAYAAAQRADLHRSYWSKLEGGEYEAPNPKTLAGIATALDVPIDQLYKIVGYETPEQHLPSLRPYLRTRYHLPHQAVVELEHYFDYLRSYYDVPADKSIFPPKPKPKVVATERPEQRPATSQKRRAS